MHIKIGAALLHYCDFILQKRFDIEKRKVESACLQSVFLAWSCLRLYQSLDHYMKLRLYQSLDHYIIADFEVELVQITATDRCIWCTAVPRLFSWKWLRLIKPRLTRPSPYDKSGGRRTPGAFNTREGLSFIFFCQFWTVYYTKHRVKIRKVKSSLSTPGRHIGGIEV